ncbi:MAG TPA: Hsp20/alpha crystallin family protein [Burkholderiales bacterium]|nr:Hsp20/alpha crystallin family protein [Burkholderiales bacterium]
MYTIARRAPFDDFFKDFGKVLFLPPLAYPGETELAMKIDVKETDRDFTVFAEIPGVKKDDISVEIDGDTVSLRAEVKAAKDEKADETTLYSERSYGMVARSFTLPVEVDDKAVIAEYRDGVLKLVLPKKAGSASRRITVS